MLAGLEESTGAGLAAQQATAPILDLRAVAADTHSCPEVRQPELSARHRYRNRRSRFKREEVDARVAAVQVRVGPDVRLQEPERRALRCPVRPDAVHPE